MKVRTIALVGVVFGAVAAANAWAHCEIPCGIYDDHARIHSIEEHISPSEKAMQLPSSITDATLAGSPTRSTTRARFSRSSHSTS